MSALSGITVSPDLASTFAVAVQSNAVRFIKVSIQNGLLFEVSLIPKISPEIAQNLLCTIVLSQSLVLSRKTW